MPKLFQASDFQPTRWNSAEDKARFANWLAQFISNGCLADKFLQWAYEKLTHTFGFIAHYNRAGFADTYFDSAQTRLRFVTNLLSYPYAGANPDCTYGDVELAIRDWMQRCHIVERYRRAAEFEQKMSERTLLAALAQKYADRPVSPEWEPQPAQLSLLSEDPRHDRVPTSLR